jgi:hypothetical protein
VGSRDYLLIGWWASRQQSSKHEAIDEQLRREAEDIMAVFQGDEKDGDNAIYEAERTKAGPKRQGKRERNV